MRHLRTTTALACPDATAAATRPRRRHDWVLLSNPQSFRMTLGNRLARLESLAHEREIPVLRVSGPENIHAAVSDALEADPASIAVAGGDGTLQAVVAELLRRSPATRRPGLLILGGGRTNLIARDVGSRGEVSRVLVRAVEGALCRRVRRPVLQARQDGFCAHGFFLAGALVDEVIRDCHAYRAAHGGALRSGRTATAWRLPQLAAMAAAGKRSFHAPELSVDAGVLGSLRGPVRLMLATTLEHAGAFYDPYARRGCGALRLTVVRADATGFWRRLPRMITGRYSPAMHPASGYLSGRSKFASVTGLSSITFDGQEHLVDPARPVEFSAPDEIEFIVP